MKPLLTVSLSCLGLLLWGAGAGAQSEALRAAGEAARRAAALTGPDHKDFLFLASDRPVLLRLHMRIDGQPYYAPWDDYIQKLFNHFDRNGDGVLNQQELERVPNVQYLQFHLQGAIGFQLQGQTLRMQQVDTNKDGKVTPAEFKQVFAQGGMSALRFSSGSNQSSTDAVTGTLFKYLDTNKDGRLSKEELKQAPTAFLRLDLDEDETISSSELTPGRGGNNPYGGPPRPRRPVTPATVEQGLIQVNPGQPTTGLAQQILAHYDKDKSGKLSRAESGLDKATFDSLDRNHDGQLDASELEGFFRRDADLEFQMRLGKINQKETAVDRFFQGIGQKLGVKGSKPRRAELVARKGPMPLRGKVSPLAEDTLKLTLGDAGIEVQASDNGGGRRGFFGFYRQQFQQALDKKKGYIDRKQAMNLQFFDDIFTLADRDGDGKLYVKELNAYLDMQEDGANCYASLSVTDQGRSVFGLIDANGDGRLSVRELRTAWDRMKSVARTPAGLARMDVARRIQVSVSQGQGGFRTLPGAVVYGGMGMSRPAPQAAPLWFRKMDRNNDGDLSPREFLGSEEDFRKLDADGDGLISAEEARKAEARLAKETKTKK